MTFALPGLPSGRYLVNYNVNATLGGAPTSFACFLSTAALTEAHVHANGVSSGGSSWYANGAGYLDATTGARNLTCLSNSPGITIPTNALHDAQVVLTRLDEVSTTAQPAG